jgi:arylsulfatase
MKSGRLGALRRSASVAALAGLSLAWLGGCSNVQPPAAPPAAAGSHQWKYYPEGPHAATGAPNVLLIMSDDVGFGASSTFGGPVPTPTFDSLAKSGLRFNEFHTTAMCSPTRAALLTGRNHHAVSFGALTDMSVDEPGYTAVLPKSAATIGRVLKENGYDTAFVGKNHNTPFWENSPVGSFDDWPNGWGFDYFYGFNAPYMDQFFPTLVENRNPVRPHRDKDYILDRDLSDHLIHWLQIQHNLHSDHPFFAYFATGTTHTPHAALPDWIKRFDGQFEEGWDKLREETFERQKKLGVIPANAVLTPRPASLPAWDSLSPEMRHAYAHMMQVDAAMLAYFDNQIGRVIDELRQSGELDNTLVIYIQGDNGASIEDFRGSNQGFAGPTTDAELIAGIDKHGTPDSFSSYPAAWGWATNAPFQYGKQVASHLGGLRDGMVMSWPARIKDAGGIRSQFSHVIDIAPTIYEAAHVTSPASIDGVKQQPLDGVSMVYTFDHPDAPGRHREQYFELLGNRSYYKDGWMASTVPGREPWSRTPVAPDPLKFQWTLYDLNTDWSQSMDVSAQYPQKLAELRADFDKAAAKYNIYPLNSAMGRVTTNFRPTLIGDRTSFAFYPGDTHYVAGYTFPVVAAGWSISASLGVSGSSFDGPIVIQGDYLGGYGFLIQDGRPTFVYNPSGKAENRVTVRAEKLRAGDHTVAVSFNATEASKVEIELDVDGRKAGSATVPAPLRTAFVPGRGDAYVGRSSVAPFLMSGPAMPEVCGCRIDIVKIEKASKAPAGSEP